MERRWHIDSYKSGGCLICGGPEREKNTVYAHKACFSGLDYIGRKEVLEIYYSIDDKEQEKPSPVSKKPLEFTVSVDMVPLAALNAHRALLARTLQWLHDAPPSEINAMAIKRREQMRELGREIAAVINPSKGSK